MAILRFASLTVYWFISANAIAQVPTTQSDQQQWRSAKESLFDLVNSGYQIVSLTVLSSDQQVTKGPCDVDAEWSTRTFYLQRGNAAAKCFEVFLTDPKTYHTAGDLGCYHLVRPFDADAKTK
jgi:hypothetical protein